MTRALRVQKVRGGCWESTFKAVNNKKVSTSGAFVLVITDVNSAAVAAAAAVKYDVILPPSLTCYFSLRAVVSPNDCVT